MGGGGWAFLCIGAAYEDGFTFGWFLVGVLALLVTGLGCIYLHRGRGPSTEAVKRRMNPDASYEPNRGSGLGLALVAGAAGFVIGAAAGRAAEDDDCEYVPVPPGLARKSWPFDAGTPAMAMRMNRSGDVEVTFDGKNWEDPKEGTDDWIVAGGQPYYW
jgi:hypothetical protein